METIRVEAKTVADAITEASIQLGTSSDNIEYKVISEGTKGFLGLGAKKAVIEAKKKFTDEDLMKEVFGTGTTEKPKKESGAKAKAEVRREDSAEKPQEKADKTYGAVKEKSRKEAARHEGFQDSWSTGSESIKAGSTSVGTAKEDRGNSAREGSKDNRDGSTRESGGKDSRVGSAREGNKDKDRRACSGSTGENGRADSGNVEEEDKESRAYGAREGNRNSREYGRGGREYNKGNRGYKGNGRNYNREDKENNRRPLHRQYANTEAPEFAEAEDTVMNPELAAMAAAGIAKEQEPKVPRVPADPEEAKARAEAFLKEMFQAMGMSVEMKMEFEEDTLSVDLTGEDMGLLIGKRGQTLDSLQYLTSLVVNKGKNSYVRVKLDTEDYRNRRKATLENLAKNIAIKVKKTRRPVFLEPMNPYERRIIHSALQNDPYVTTHSEGEEPNRKVVVTPKRRDMRPAGREGYRRPYGDRPYQRRRSYGDAASERKFHTEAETDAAQQMEAAAEQTNEGFAEAVAETAGAGVQAMEHAAAQNSENAAGVERAAEQAAETVGGAE